MEAVVGRWNGSTGKRIMRPVIVVVILLSGMLVPDPVQAATARVSATASVNLRSCPTLECQVLAQIPLGDSVEVTGSAVNGFLPVRWTGVDGWAYQLYLSTGSAAPYFVEGSPVCSPQVGFVFNIGIGYTPSQSILDTLIAEGVPATMFPMGSFARSQPAYLQQLANAGFPIGTHGDRNRYLTDVSDAMVRQDTLDSVAAIEAVIGRPLDPLHTPYAADTDNRVRTIVADLGLLPVGWTLGANDYAATATEQAVYSRVMGNVFPGAVFEFHLDGPATAQSTALALPRIIRDLRAQGYSFATIPDMVQPCGATWPASPAIQGQVTAAAGSLRCRTRPTTLAQVITTLAAGTRVPVRGQTFDGWVPVTCSSRNGWMFAEYLALSQAPPTPSATPSPTTTPVSTTPPPSPATEAVVSNTGGAMLRCRAAASTSAAIITSLAPGTRVTVRGAAANGWYPIRCSNQDGWASATYLTIVNATTPTPTAPPPTPAGTTGTVVNTGGATLRCRSGPNTTAAVITSLQPGAVVPVRGATSNGWVPIACAGQAGWVSSTYLRLSN